MLVALSTARSLHSHTHASKPTEAKLTTVEQLPLQFLGLVDSSTPSLAGSVCYNSTQSTKSTKELPCYAIRIAYVYTRRVGKRVFFQGIRTYQTQTVAVGRCQTSLKKHAVPPQSTVCNHALTSVSVMCAFLLILRGLWQPVQVINYHQTNRYPR